MVKEHALEVQNSLGTETSNVGLILVRIVDQSKVLAVVVDHASMVDEVISNVGGKDII